ncbi:MAG: YcaQ family DNA glycosylase [Thaumarchaeota archaeon]|nr:YcaQ family DNA glycosylase [Nitrososphaerota archaeon]
MTEGISATLASIRRLAVVKQHLSGKLPRGSPGEQILSVVRDLAYVQWDPIEVVTPSHVLTLWNRVGGFRPSDLESLMWEKKELFEHWVNFAASLVLTEDYPLYYSMMKRYPDSIGKSWGSRKPRTERYLARHRSLRSSILGQLKHGPLKPDEFREYAPAKSKEEWTPGSEVSRMLFHLDMSGEAMVVGHEGKRNVWGLAEKFLPPQTVRREMPVKELERRTVERAIRALGTASPRDINYYFPRGRYQDLKGALESLLEESTIHVVRVEGVPERGDRYVHEKDVALLSYLEDQGLEPRMSLLPPFDNLISGRKRTNLLFGFDYNHEMFLPASRRKFGYYVLPILWGDEFVGRIDPRFERDKGRLMVHAVHAEAGYESDREMGTRVAGAIGSLAEFVGAERVEYSGRVPEAWRNALH